MSPAAAAPLFRPYHVLMSMVFAVALGAAYSMLPGDNEIIAMLERDGHSRDAIAILEQNYDTGDRRHRTLHQMLELYENEGNTLKARSILEEMVRQRPGDAGLRDRLARFYRAIGDGKARVAALKAQIETRYNEAACREYVSLVRLEGGGGAEIAALQACRQKGYRRPDDLARLGVLLASAGERQQAATLLRAIDDVRRLKAPEDRHLLVALLLEADQPNEAERRAIRWIKAGNNDALGLSLVDMLARSKYPDTALKIAKAAGGPGDTLSLTVAERLIERSQAQAASLYLRGWMESAQLSQPDVAERFVSAALEAGDPTTALAGARKLGLSRLPAGSALTLGGALFVAGMSKEAEEVRAAAAGPLAVTPGGDTAATQAEPPVPAARARGAPEAAGKPKGPAAAVDPLASWRRALASRMADDAVKRMPAASPPAPARTVVPAAEPRTPQSQKVLHRASRVLQRTKHLKSLKMRQKLARERDKKRGR